MADSDSNRAAIEAFAAHFDPPLDVMATERIDGKPVAAAYMCARHLPEHEVGVTAICWGKGYFRAWIEATGTREDTDLLGYAFAGVLQNAKGSSQTAENLSATPIAEDAASPAQTPQNIVQSASPQASEGCEHEFRHQAFAARAICWKCGAQSPKPVEPAPEAAEASDLHSEMETAENLSATNPTQDASPPAQPHQNIVQSASPQAIDGCKHKFRPNMHDMRWTCWKCGVQSPKV